MAFFFFLFNGFDICYIPRARVCSGTLGADEKTTRHLLKGEIPAETLASARGALYRLSLLSLE